MVWLLPLLFLGIAVAHRRVDEAEREQFDTELEREAQKLQAAQEAAEQARQEAAANKKRGDQYLAMKPTSAGQLGYRGLDDLNGENPRHL